MQRKSKAVLDADADSAAGCLGSILEVMTSGCCLDSILQMGCSMIGCGGVIVAIILISITAFKATGVYKHVPCRPTSVASVSTSTR
jgi:hypothetical protein